MASVSHFARVATFQLIEPNGLPAPRGVYRNGDAAIAFIYNLAPYGRVVLIEAESEILPGRRPMEEFRSGANRSCSDDVALRIRGGKPALAVDNSTLGQVDWIEHGTEGLVLVRDGAQEQAIDIANRL